MTVLCTTTAQNIGTGVTADSSRLTNTFQRNLHASIIIPVFHKLCGFVPGVPLPSRTHQRGLGTVAALSDRSCDDIIFGHN